VKQAMPHSSPPPSIMLEKSDIALSRHIEDASHPPNDSIAMQNAAIEKSISKKCDVHIILLKYVDVADNIR
jgi:hypothetical protein